MGEPCPQHPCFSNALGVLPWLIFTPWKAHPAPASLPRSQAGGRKAGACGRSPGTHTHHSSLLSAPLPAPTPRSRPHSRPPRCLTPGWLMALQVPAGMDGCYPRLLLKEPISAELPLCLSLPSLPAAKCGCWKTENGGARWEMQGSASSPAAGAEVPLGRSAGRSRSTGEGREVSDGQGCVGRVGQMPRHPSPQILPILCCSIPAGIHGELNPIVLGASCRRLPSIRQAGIREATGKRCPSHPECPTVGSSRPTSCLRDTNKKFCNP